MLSRFVPILSKLKALKNHGRLMWHAFRHADTPKWIKGIMIAVVVYLVSPIDVIPDFALILGLTDDAIVITVAMWFLGQMIPESVRHSLEEGENFPTRTERGPNAKGAASTTPQPDRKSSSLKKPLLAGLLVGLIILAAVNAQYLGQTLQAYLP